MTPAIGTSAPPFKLYSSDKQWVSLEDFKGQPVVLLFYPLAFTSTCTAELCSTRDDIAEYDAVKATVLGISVDAYASLAKYKESLNLNFPLLSDFNKEAIEAYGVANENHGYGMKGVARRAVFVIDAEGIIQHVEVLDNPGLLPDLEKVKAVLRDLHKS